jgi:hypothetical protein
VLAETPFRWALEQSYDVVIAAVGDAITCRIGDASLSARDESPERFRDGGIGILVNEGAVSTDAVRVTAP